MHNKGLVTKLWSNEAVKRLLWVILKSNDESNAKMAEEVAKQGHNFTCRQVESRRTEKCTERLLARKGGAGRDTASPGEPGSQTGPDVTVSGREPQNPRGGRQAGRHRDGER